MKNNEEKLKDAILLELCEKNGEATLNKISEELKLDYYLVDYLSDDLIARGFVYFKQISGGMRAGASKILAVTSKGRYFLKFGGYNREYRANIHKRIWHITKIFAVVIHSLLLLLFAYLTIDVQKENNTLQEKTLRQQHESEKDSCGVRWNGKELYN